MRQYQKLTPFLSLFDQSNLNNQIKQIEFSQYWD